MTIYSFSRSIVVALSIVGSAISLFSCRSQQVEEQTINYETFRTEYSENMSMIMSENGRKSYHFETPLIEGYNMAKDPYKEFRKGIKITTFEDDSVSSVAAVLTANYAIFYENRKLWEAKGDVVVTNSDGRKLYTSQLFWNQATHKVYSNVDSKIVGEDEVYHCEGFESDEQMKEWTYRKLRGVTYFEEDQFNNQNSSKQDSVQVEESKTKKTSAGENKSSVAKTKTVSKPTPKGVQRTSKGGKAGDESIKIDTTLKIQDISASQPVRRSGMKR